MLVGKAGFEPAASASRTQRAAKLRHFPWFRRRDGNRVGRLLRPVRTCDYLLVNFGRRGALLLSLLTLTVLIAVGCADDTATEVGPATSDTAASSTTAAAAPATMCTASTYTVEYPAGWSTNAETQGEPCEWFHPEPFEIPENSEAVGIAVHLRYDEVDFDFVTDPSNHSEEVLDREAVEVDGRTAVRMHTRSTGEGLLDKGVQSITWFVDTDGLTFTGATHGVAPGGLEQNGPVLDEMMRSLRFGPEPGGPPESVP